MDTDRSKEEWPILVVDDERGVRQLVARMLSNEGYKIVQAEDGEGAYALVREQQGRFAAVITDIRMPRMNGSELTERLRAEFPALKILCMSAYADSLSPNGHYFIAKPFTRSALVAIVRDVLLDRTDFAEEGAT